MSVGSPPSINQGFQECFLCQQLTVWNNRVLLSIWPELVLGEQTVVGDPESLVYAPSQFLAVYALSPI